MTRSITVSIIDRHPAAMIGIETAFKASRGFDVTSRRLTQDEDESGQIDPITSDVVICDDQAILASLAGHRPTRTSGDDAFVIVAYVAAEFPGIELAALLAGSNGVISRRMPLSCLVKAVFAALAFPDAFIGARYDRVRPLNLFDLNPGQLQPEATQLISACLTCDGWPQRQRLLAENSLLVTTLRDQLLSQSCNTRFDGVWRSAKEQSMPRLGRSGIETR